MDLDCREPARCKLCYLQNVCDTLYGVRDQVITRDFARLRVDTTWEPKQGPIWGGDPASSKRARAIEAQLAEGGLTALPTEAEAVRRRRRPRAKLRLPVLGQGPRAAAAAADARWHPPPARLAAQAGAEALWVVAPDVAGRARRDRAPPDRSPRSSSSSRTTAV